MKDIDGPRQSLPEAPKIDMNVFRSKVAEAIKSPESAKSVGEFVLSKINIAELKEEDALMEYQIDHYVDEVTHEIFNAYAVKVLRSGSESRTYFQAMLATKLTSILIRRGIEEAERQKTK